MGASNMAQFGRAFVAKPEFNPQDPYDERQELIHAIYPVLHTFMMAHTTTPTVIQIYE